MLKFKLFSIFSKWNTVEQSGTESNKDGYSHRSFLLFNFRSLPFNPFHSFSIFSLRRLKTPLRINPFSLRRLKTPLRINPFNLRRLTCLHSVSAVKKTPLRINPFYLLIPLFLTSCSPSELPQKQWYKGNLHTHSLWSDGDDYPEMIMDWYKSNGYHFIGLSDHNILQEGEKWIKVPNNPLRRNAFQKYLDHFGDRWVAYQEIEDTIRVRLKTLEEYDSLFTENGRFLIIKSEEITDIYEDKPIHLNATNIAHLIEPQGGNSVVEVMQKNIDAVLAQRDSTGQAMFPHLNHPNFRWAITAEEMMQLRGERFFEVFNGHPLVNNYGDSTRIGTEEMWDQINLHYLEVGQPLMFGIATDDSHNYHLFGPMYSNTGRGWVMVYASELSANALIEAMEAGDFYATTGITLDFVKATKKSVSLKVKTEVNVQYTIQFIGVPKGAKKSSILMEVKDTMATYTFNEELFVRAKVLSDKPKVNPFEAGDVETAWTQPVENIE